MRLRTLRNDMSLAGKRVLIRIDANVPLQNGQVVDGRFGKIARSAVTIEWLRQKGARIIVATHVGRPAGRRIVSLSTRAVARRLTELLGVPVSHTKQSVGSVAERAVARLKPGQVLVLENVRFDIREEQNAATFGAELAHLADIYVNDAFAVCHRAHASVSAVTEYIPSFAGPLLSHEVSVLEKAARSPKKPFVILVGGRKMTSKLPVLERLLPLADAVLIGGALAHPFFVATKRSIGASVFEEEGVASARRLLTSFSKKIVLPTDVCVVKRIRRDAHLRTAYVGEVLPDEHIIDIGPDTIRTFSEYVLGAKTVIWNGPLGYTEVPRFCEGTEQLAKAIASVTGKTTTVVGGGDTIPIVERLGLVEKVTLASTGGGAMLALLAGDTLPGLIPVMRPL